MAVFIAQKWCLCLCMLKHGFCSHVSKLEFFPVHYLQLGNKVYLHCLAAASSGKTDLLVCSSLVIILRKLIFCQQE